MFEQKSGEVQVEQKIGEMAGEVYRALERHGSPVELDTLRKQVRDHGTVSTDMAAGWLAREGKVYFQAEGDTLRVGLRR